MLDNLLTLVSTMVVSVIAFYLMAAIANWIFEQEHRRTLEDRKSLKQYLRQDKEDEDEQGKDL